MISYLAGTAQTAGDSCRHFYIRSLRPYLWQGWNYSQLTQEPCGAVCWGVSPANVCLPSAEAMALPASICLSQKFGPMLIHIFFKCLHILIIFHPKICVINKNRPPFLLYTPVYSSFFVLWRRGLDLEVNIHNDCCPVLSPDCNL